MNKYSKVYNNQNQAITPALNLAKLHTLMSFELKNELCKSLFKKSIEDAS